MGGDNMGLLVDENVEVQITRRNRKYYREKGYNIPDCYEGNFAIKSIDINPKSKIAMLPFICDCCGKNFIVQPKIIIKETILTMLFVRTAIIYILKNLCKRNMV